MRTVVVAEKPSVARDIARVLGARKRGQGCLEGNGYVVTWALGHLLHLAEPDDYGVDWQGRWSMGQLPMVPERWKLKTAKATVQQFQVVKRLLNDASTERVVCATDAGREGENIFRLIYRHARCRKPYQRLWVSSLTDEAIREGFRRLAPSTDFDNLGRAAWARAQADWLVGMNLTRAYTVHNKVLFTIGRVQTPTLAMIVERDALIARFEKRYYYELQARFTEGFSARYSDDGETRIDSQPEAERLHRELSPNLTGRVLAIESKKRRIRPPALYDLTNLQRDANRRFGFTAAQVLEHAQALYETHKLITYPRTESRHISEDMLPELPGILGRLAHPQAEMALERLRGGHRLSKAYVDQTKLTDHHAILPTGKPQAQNLSSALRKIYELVVARFVAVFLSDHEVVDTHVQLDVGGAVFLARGSVVLEQGWKCIETPRDPEDRSAPRALPVLRQGQVVHVDRMDLLEKETQPPKHYNDATLLAAMKSAGRDIDDDALAEAMKHSGLGTPATRAEIIEKLIRTAYVQRTRKQLRATEKGRALIGLVADKLRSPELTARWEQQLKEVEEGSRPVEEFYGGIVGLVRELIPTIAKGQMLSGEQRESIQRSSTRSNGQGPDRRVSSTGLGKCPLCGEGEIVESAKAFGCSRYREGCGLTVWKIIARKKLTRTQVLQLLRTGCTERIEGFQSKSGKPFTAALKLGESRRVEMDFSDDPQPGIRVKDGETPGQGHDVVIRPLSGSRPAAPSQVPVLPTCPKCGRGTVIKGRRGFGCDRYREGCDFVVWREIAGKRLTEKQIHTLVSRRTTPMIKGFREPSGTKFAARLRLDSQCEVVLEKG